MPPVRNPGTDLLHRAALLALRGHGHVEPNPMVGCIVTDGQGEIVGMGHHERFGRLHAEINALQSAGARARGGTMYVTLEPCAHQGKTPPCTEAIIRAGIARVVVAQRDPTSDACGGAERLRDSGIDVTFDDSSALANDVSAPFRHRVQTGLPWVIAKWAQTLDGRMINAPHEPRWISNETSRRMVHRERGRVDAILTGIGTVIADDPLLLPANVPVRRRPQRIVLDTHLRVPVESQFIKSSRHDRVLIVCGHRAYRQRETPYRSFDGAILHEVSAEGESIGLALLLHDLSGNGLATILTEAGPTLIASLFREKLANQAWAFVGGGAKAIDDALASVSTMVRAQFSSIATLSLQSMRKRREDLILLYRID